MKILLDTCEFLWYVSGDPALLLKTREEIQNPRNEVFLSVVSLWEIIVKHSLGKLSLPQEPDVYVPTQRDSHRIRSLNLEELSVMKLSSLPAYHRDPFDRMLLARRKPTGCISPRATH